MTVRVFPTENGTVLHVCRPACVLTGWLLLGWAVVTGVWGGGCAILQDLQAPDHVLLVDDAERRVRSNGRRLKQVAMGVLAIALLAGVALVTVRLSDGALFQVGCANAGHSVGSAAPDGTPWQRPVSV